MFQGIIANMDVEDSRPLSGRRAEAARNDRKILEAAREVFVADPEAPISKVAERAGVGIGACTVATRARGLLRRLSSEGLRRYISEAEAALADEDDPWAAFAAFVSESWTPTPTR